MTSLVLKARSRVPFWAPVEQIMQKLKRSRIWAASAALALLLPSCSHLQSGRWPAIKEASVRHHFAATKESEKVRAVIYSQEGKAMYCLDARFCWRDYETGDYDFSGALD